jgi:DnaD/phage-associated family protein
MKWFRFYSEALDDPKVQRLPSNLFKIWVNLLSLANTGNPRGRLPTVSDVAYRLRVKTEKATALLEEFQTRGLLDEIEGRLVPHGWDERQPESDNAKERMRRTRSEHVLNKFGLEQKQSRTELETDIEVEQQRPQIFALYESVIGLITAPIRERLLEAEKEYPEQWIEDAFQEAAENNVRKWRYVEVILERWQTDGRNGNSPQVDPQVAWLERRYREGKARLETVK